jgi:hypothetical protein
MLPAAPGRRTEDSLHRDAAVRAHLEVDFAFLMATGGSKSALLVTVTLPPQFWNGMVTVAVAAEVAQAPPAQALTPPPPGA